jgi:hypothetical protein
MNNEVVNDREIMAYESEMFTIPGLEPIIKSYQYEQILRSLIYIYIIKISYRIYNFILAMFPLI